MNRLVSAVLIGMTLLIASCTGSSGSEPSSSSTGESLEGVALSGLEATQDPHWKADGSNWVVSLSWEAPSADVDHYVVTRNTSIVVNDLTETTFDDDEVWPGTGYRYSVEAVSADAEHSKPGVVKIKTMKPPLAEARLAGDYDVRLSPEDWENTSSPKPFVARFSFRPTCPPSEGACDVRWGEYYGTATGVLERSGSTYDGTAHGTFILGDCYGNKVDETITIHVKVVTARATGDRTWEARTIEGTFSDDSALAPGCSGAVSIDWTFESD